MSILDYLDPTGNNFLGMGKYLGRAAGDVATMGQGEWFRPDPFGMGRNTLGGQIGHGVGGAMEGAGGGFITGGVPGAVVGGATGGVRSGMGQQNPWTMGGGATNFGIGAGEGAVIHGAQTMMGGPAAGGASSPSAQPMSPVMKALMAMRGQVGQPATQQTPENPLEKLYSMYPMLRPQAGGFNGY